MDTTPYDPRTLYGLRNGFSWCRECGDTWNWKKRFCLPTGPLTGTFPVCSDCGWDMPIEGIMAHLKAVRDSREPYTDVDGKIHAPEFEDLGLAEHWLRIWKVKRKPGEDPSDVKSRLRAQRGPKEWHPAFGEDPYNDGKNPLTNVQKGEEGR